MTEHYDLASARHVDAGDVLLGANNLDDAGYHFGLAGECSIKHALVAAGVSGSVSALKPNLMLKHLPTISPLVHAAKATISLFASGRLAGPISTLLLDPSLLTRFNGWKIDIRYADDSCCPVTLATVQAWKGDAEDFVLAFVL